MSYALAALMLATDDIARAWRAHEAGVTGDFSQHDEIVARLVESGARAFALVLSAQRALGQPGRAAMPSLDEIVAAAAVDDLEMRRAGARACAHVGRAALLLFDRGLLDASVDAASHLLGADTDHPSAWWRDVGRAWASLVRGQHEGVEVVAADVAARARDCDAADLVVESSVLRAMAAIVAVDLESALGHARRASRMARTESLPQEEYLANAVLARVRRLTGRPHLATLILTSLLRVATEPWRPWLVTELVLAHGAAGDGPPPEVATLLLGWLDAARVGDRGALTQARDAFWHRVAGFDELARDAHTLHLVCDPDADLGDASAEVLAWVSGSSDAVPRGLFGVAAPGSVSPGDEPDVALVVSPASGTARRLLAPARSLLPRDTTELPPTPKKQARTDATVAALLLAGQDGVDEDALFGSIYGFAYDAALHRGVRDVLYHRARQRLGELATLERANGRVRIDKRVALSVSDPRSALPRDHVLVRLLAQRGHASAKEAAELLGIPIRTAQDALRRLVEDGACRAEKEGRHIEYHLEDTTFMEPTRA